MNYATHRISLDIHRPESQTVINMKRGDTSRRIKISLTEDGRPYTLTSDCSAVFKAKKPDGKNIYLDCVIEGNVIIYNVSSQTTASLGEVDCEIMLFNEMGELLTSPRFTIIINDTVHSQGSIVESDSEAKTKLIKLLKDNTKSAVEDYLKENPITGVSEEQAKNIKDNTLARHTHKNTEVLDKLAESEGNLTYNGKVIGGSVARPTAQKTYSKSDGTVELFTDNNMFYGFFWDENADIPVGTELADVEIVMAGANVDNINSEEDIDDKYVSIKNMHTIDGVPTISLLDRVIFNEGMSYVFFAIYMPCGNNAFAIGATGGKDYIIRITYYTD